MHRARWTSFNGKAVNADQLTGQARRLAEREFNLSVMPEQLAADNKISIRTVDWNSMRPNFFVLGSAGLLPRQSAQFITSFYLPSPNVEQQKALLRAFPTLTLFDLNQILNEVRTLILRASQAVQYVFLFTLLAGLVVLLSAFAAGEAERIRETAVLRVLGASRRHDHCGARCLCTNAANLRTVGASRQIPPTPLFQRGEQQPRIFERADFPLL
ncbi:MAG: hypothetical protein IE913_10605 [Halothiobacillus sp.]|nr:hypothetical protein [Halothiobacillus sp.]